MPTEDITPAPRTPPPLAPTLPATAWSAEVPSLLRPVRQAMAAGADRTALLLPPLPAHARRAARLLLQDAARAGDGTALDAASGEILLLGVRAEAAGQAIRGLEMLGLPAGTGFALDPGTAAPLLDWASRARPATRPDPGLVAGLAASLAALDPDAVVVRRSVLRLGPGAAPRRVGCHAAVSRRRLAAALGPTFAGDADLMAEAAGLAEARVAALETGAGPAPPMLRPGPDGPPCPGAVALLPLGAAAEPARLAETRAGLGAAGWAGIGLDGLDATVLPLLDPTALPREGPLLLRWSPALDGRAVALALRGLADPARLVLTGCADADAMGWGFEAGIRHFAGAAVEALIEAARRGRPA